MDLNRNFIWGSYFPQAITQQLFKRFRLTQLFEGDAAVLCPGLWTELSWGLP